MPGKKQTITASMQWFSADILIQFPESCGPGDFRDNCDMFVLKNPLDPGLHECM